MKAKSLKKPSDEDKSRLKKSKSKKRKIRYSSSNSADSARKKPRKSKELKKKRKKKPRRASTPPASLSYSSDHSISSCSTCEKRKGSRSRSPTSRSNGKSKLRKARNVTSSKYKGRERGRSHKRSRSCSTCSSTSTRSERSRSRSPRSSKKVRKDREKDDKAQVLRQGYSDSEERDKVIPAYDDIASPFKDEENEMQESLKESDSVADVSEKVVPEKTRNDGMKKTGVVDVELILRQKALENFIKFHKVKKCGLSGDNGEPVRNEPNEEVVSVPDAVATDKEREEPTLDEPTKVITDVDLKGKGGIIADTSARKPKLRSVIIIPTERDVSEDSTAIGTGEVSNGIKEVPKHVEDQLDKVSEPSLSLNPDPSSPVAPGLRKDEVPRETTSVGVETAAAQYEKKTFSRKHEGETVQVSYKVYIPKKAPALARRKLQRGEASTS